MSPTLARRGTLTGVIFAGTLVLALGAVIFVPELAALTATVVYLTLVLLALLIPLGVSILLRQPFIVWTLTVFVWMGRVAMLAMLKAYSFSVGLGGFFPTDADAYLYHSLATSGLATGDWFSTLLERSSPLYVYIIAGLYTLAGVDLTVPQLLNLGLSILVVPLLYQLAARASGHRSAVLAVLAWGVLPSGMLWSISMIKDVWVVVGILLCAISLIAVSRGSLTAGHLVAGAVGVAFIGFMRPPYLLLPAITLLVLMISQRGKRVTLHQKVLILGGGVAALMVLDALGFDIITRLMREVDRSTSDEGVAQLATIAMQGGSGIPFLLDLRPEIRWLAQLPFALAAPFPWQWGSMGSGFGRIAAIEMIILYYSYATVARNWSRIWNSPEGKVLLLLAMACFLAVSFGLPNIGSLYRYRWPAVVLLLAAAPLAGRRALMQEGAPVAGRRRLPPFRSAASVPPAVSTR